MAAPGYTKRILRDMSIHDFIALEEIMKYKLTVVILTYNEAIHIERAIQNVTGWADKVIVLDSHSQDTTAKIAQDLNAEVIYRKFDNYKNQRQYAIDYCKNQTEWMLFLDADEYLLEALKTEIKISITHPHITGYYMPRRFIFMGKWIKRGGYYPTYLLRLFRPELATVDRTINEHVTVQGATQKLKHDFVDHNLNGIGFWIAKHNQYATVEAEALLWAKQNKPATSGINFWVQADRKRWIRENIWNHLPLLMKPFLYFAYRYMIRLGFLDGKEGLIFHFLQGCWFWFLVSAKYLEMEKTLRSQQ